MKLGKAFELEVYEFEPSKLRTTIWYLVCAIIVALTVI